MGYPPVPSCAPWTLGAYSWIPYAIPCHTHRTGIGAMLRIHACTCCTVKVYPPYYTWCSVAPSYSGLSNQLASGHCHGSMAISATYAYTMSIGLGSSQTTSIDSFVNRQQLTGSLRRRRTSYFLLYIHICVVVPLIVPVFEAHFTAFCQVRQRYTQQYVAQYIANTILL